jgi:hypothetical protein
MIHAAGHGRLVADSQHGSGRVCIRNLPAARASREADLRYGPTFYHPIGTYGSQAAGFLDLQIDLIRDFPSKAVIPAILEVDCNAGLAGLSNPGKEEGFYLEIPGTIFVEGGAGGPFEPAGVSVTTFSIRNERRGGDRATA